MLGPNGPAVSEIGLGCMGMSAFYGAADEGEARATIARALDLGCNFLDTSDMYGPYTNERLVGGAIEGRRDEVFLATKFGIKLVDESDLINRVIDGQPRVRALRVRRLAGASRRRGTSTSTTSTASIRTRRSRTPSERWRSSWRPARCATSASRRRAPRRSAARTPSTRSRRCRPSTRCGRATSSPRSCPRSRSSGSRWSPTRRSDAGFCPAASHRPRSWTRATIAASGRASRARTSSSTWCSPSACASSRPRGA